MGHNHPSHLCQNIINPQPHLGGFLNKILPAVLAVLPFKIKNFLINFCVIVYIFCLYNYLTSKVNSFPDNCPVFQGFLAYGGGFFWFWGVSGYN